MGIASLPAASSAGASLPSAATTAVVEGIKLAGDPVYTTTLSAGTYAIKVHTSKTGIRDFWKDFYIGRELKASRTVPFNGGMSGDTMYLKLDSTETIAIAPRPHMENLAQLLDTASLTGGPYAMHYLNGRYITQWYLNTESYVAWSTNGTAWSKNEAKLIGATGTVGPQQYGWGYGNGYYVATNTSVNPTAINYSTDLTTWNQGTATGFASTGYAVAFQSSANRFVVCSVSGTTGTNIATTTTGSMGTWTVPATTIAQGLYQVIFADSKFVATGNNGACITSTDGTTWTTRTTGVTISLRTLAHGGGKFVAIGSSGGIIYSTDAITWTVGTLTASSNDMGSYGPTYMAPTFNRLRYYDGKFIASHAYHQNGYRGGFSVSTDGITWVFVDYPIVNEEGVSYTGNPVVTNNYIITSHYFGTDGDKIYGIAFNNENVVLSLVKTEPWLLSIYNVTTTEL